VTYLALLAANDPDWIHTVASPQILVFCIPIGAIAGGIALAITKTVVSHHERIAKIQQGIDPDAKGGPS
jgi:hypothetical protein